MIFRQLKVLFADEKAREMQKIQKQNDNMEENLQASASTKNKRKEKVAISFLSTKVKKKMRWRS